MKRYVIYDGRANYDIDSAGVIEAFVSPGVVNAKRYVAKHYKDDDVVLCDSDGNIIY